MTLSVSRLICFCSSRKRKSCYNLWVPFSIFSRYNQDCIRAKRPDPSATQNNYRTACEERGSHEKKQKSGAAASENHARLLYGNSYTAWPFDWGGGHTAGYPGGNCTFTAKWCKTKSDWIGNWWILIPYTTAKSEGSWISIFFHVSTIIGSIIFFCYTLFSIIISQIK